jgi:tetratricopeptide (TPR) repeat protein
VAEVSTAAVYEMAELYRRLGADLIHSERPKALAGEELEQYGLLLEEQAYPFEEKAIEIHSANAARAAAGVYDQSVRASFSALATLSPGRFGKSEEAEPLTIDISCGTGVTPEISVMVRFQEAVALAASKPSEAEGEFVALRAAQPSLAGPAYNLGVLWVAAGHAAEAIAPLEAARALAPGDPAVADELGLAYRQVGRFSEAAAAYRAAIEIDGGLGRPHRNLAVLLDLYLGRPADAIPEAELARSNGGDEKLLSGWITEMTRRASPSHPAEAEKTP